MLGIIGSCFPIIFLKSFFFYTNQGAERKNKDESKSAERRLQKWMKQNSPGLWLCHDLCKIFHLLFNFEELF